jgi:hypothetical protein
MLTIYQVTEKPKYIQSISKEPKVLYLSYKSLENQKQIEKLSIKGGITKFLPGLYVSNILPRRVKLPHSVSLHLSSKEEFFENYDDGYGYVMYSNHNVI